MVKNLFILILSFFSYYTIAQSYDSDSIAINVVDSIGAKVIGLYKIENDSISIENKTNFIIDSLIDLGYLNPIFEVIDSAKIIIVKGVQYKWLDIDMTKDDEQFFKKQHIRIDSWKSKYISPSKMKTLSEMILKYADNHGYPFALVKLDSINFVGVDSISARLKVNFNKRFYFDTIKNNSKVDLSYIYLENFLDIKKGDIYNKNKVGLIKDKISNLPFVELQAAPRISFLGDKASVILALKSRKVNRFDFIIGLQPDETGVSKFKLTGEITSELINRLGRGERLYFKYKNLAQGKQRLNMEMNYPYIFNMPFGFDSKFSIYINEKSYRDVKLDIGGQYLFQGINYLKSYWTLFSSRLINIDSTSILGTLKLPSKLDVQTNSLGLKLNYGTLDYRFNPRRGFKLILDGNIGQRKILKNQQIIKLSNANIDFNNSYDSLKLSSYQFNLSAELSYYMPIKSNIVVKISNDISWKKSEVKLYENELYKIGGNKLLRGFDEESIYGDFYNVATAELRLIIDKNSFLFVFADYAFVRNPFFTTKKWDHPYGFGAGINFDTKGGIIKLSTAVGSQQENPIDFKNVKIHLGYVSLF